MSEEDTEDTANGEERRVFGVLAPPHLAALIILFVFIIVGVVWGGSFISPIPSKERDATKKAMVDMGLYLKTSSHLRVVLPEGFFRSEDDQASIKKQVLHLQSFLTMHPHVRVVYPASCFSCAEDANQFAKIINATGVWLVTSVGGTVDGLEKKGILFEPDRSRVVEEKPSTDELWDTLDEKSVPETPSLFIESTGS